MSERAMSCLCPERREEPRAVTDYRQGQRSRPKPRLQLFVMGAGRRMWGTKRGTQKRQVFVKESRKEKGETPPTHKHTHTQTYFILFFLKDCFVGIFFGWCLT